MNRSRLIRRTGKYLGKHLRHDPDQTGLEHAPGGWARVDGAPRCLREGPFPVTREELEEVVARNDNRRFSFDHTGELVRAN